MTKITVTLSKKKDRILFEFMRDKKLAFINTLDSNPFIKIQTIALSEMMLDEHRDQPVSVHIAVRIHKAIMAAEFLYGSDNVYFEDTIRRILCVFESVIDVEEVQKYLSDFPGELVRAMNDLNFAGDEYWRATIATNLIEKLTEKPEEQ